MESVLLNNGLKSPNMDDFFVQKAVEVMVDMKTKKLAKEMDSMKEAMNRLSEEIQSIKQGMVSRAPVSQGSLAEVKESNESNNTAQEIKDSHSTRVINAKSNEQAPKPRFGDYKPGDIDINKFFYCGGKR